MTRFFIPLLLLVFVVAGCGKNKKPSGFPPVYPCSITILKDGAPLDKVGIMLNADVPAFHNIAYSGETNSSGKAEIRTVCPGYDTKGLPAGEYALLIKKSDAIEGEKPKEEIKKMSGEELEVYSAMIEKNRKNHKPTIPPHFWEFETTPLRITVEKGGVDVTFDIKDYPAKGK